MKELIINCLNSIDFSNHYITICNEFSNINSKQNFTKKEIETILDEYIDEYMYSSKDKTFYKDYKIKNYEIRFSFTYKYGYIECFYAILNVFHNLNLYGRFNTISSLYDEKFNEKVKSKFPIATSLNDLDDILRRIILINDGFVEKLFIEIEKNQ